jgi:8-oxo-dGTP pyrophosphatase MutT (NUDIX family)
MLSHPGGDILYVADAVAAIIMQDDGRYLLLHRDDVPNIWYPGHWGCFGGALDEGEAPLDALRRELREELEWEPREARYFTWLEFDLGQLGLGRCSRTHYVASISSSDRDLVVMHEGQGFAAYSADEMFLNVHLAPYDAFALFIHHARGRLRATV